MLRSPATKAAVALAAVALLCVAVSAATVNDHLIISSGGRSPPGFLDAYASLNATWGWSTKELRRSYSGNAMVVERISDSATKAIGWDSSGNANVSTFEAFCGGTLCYAKTLYDQVNEVNATLSSGYPIVQVGSNGLLAVCPQPGTYMTTPYNAAVNTPVVHLFAVVQAQYFDSRWSQPNAAHVVITGNVARNSATITSMSKQTGMSLATGAPLPPLPGITDSAAYIPPGTTVSAFPTKSSARLTFENGATMRGSQIGDTLSYTNAVLPGAWIVNGPASSSYSNSAYWGVGLGSASDNIASDFIAPTNGSGNPFAGVIGNGMRGQWAVYDYDTGTQQVDYDGADLGIVENAKHPGIAYLANTGMTLFSDTNGVETASQSCFEAMVLFSATERSRVAMAHTLMDDDKIPAFPFAPATSDGFSWTGFYQAGYSQAQASVYGTHSYGPDINGLTWNLQSGGYTWPSISVANNINNSATMWRFIVKAGDSDMNITSAERAEIDTAADNASPGHGFSFFYQFQFESAPEQTGDWCAFGQFHYNNVLNSAPDIVSYSCRNNQLQLLTQCCGPSFTSTNCGLPIRLTQGTVYAVYGTGFWSSDHKSDKLDVWEGVNGTTLTHQCSTSGALWDNDTGAHLKAGVYRGYPWHNAGTMIVRVMNLKASEAAGTYDSYITTQPALPTHP